MADFELSKSLRWQIMGFLSGLRVKFGAKWTNFAVLFPFDPGLLIKRRILVHFLVNLIYGGFWEILGCPHHSIDDLWGFEITSRAKFWIKWTNFAILVAFDPGLLIKSRILSHFLVNLIYGGVWGSLGCPHHSIGDLLGFKVASRIKFGTKCTNFSILVSIHSGLLIDSRIPGHFMLNLRL